MKTSQSLTFSLIFFTLISLAFSQRCHPNDQKALLEIKQHFNNANVFASWLPNTDCCDWVNTECDPQTNRTNAVRIFRSNLNRPLPSSIGDLPYLVHLTFHRTRLTGQIPQSITKLTRLESLDLRYNRYSGPIPSFLGELENLSFLGLSYNSFNGSIPSSLSKLTNMYSLNLDRNKLTGPIPDTFSQFKGNEIYLTLSHNQLSGRVPRSLGDANFTSFEVSNNRLEGDISFLFGKDKSTQVYDFSRNMLAFDMSKLELPRTLTRFDLNHNRIYGSLPNDLAKFDYLDVLDVSYNRLCGRIPVSRFLQALDMSNYANNRCLCGAPLPPCN